MLFIRVDPALECNRAEILGVGTGTIQVSFSRKYCFEVFGAEMVGVGSGIINVSFQGSTAVECAKHKLSLLSVFWRDNANESAGQKLLVLVLRLTTRSKPFRLP